MSSRGPGGHSLVETRRLVLPGPGPTRRDTARLCARLARLYEGGATAVECDVGAVTAPDLAAVEVLARLRLTARGRGGFTVTGAGPALRALLGLVGLVELLGEPEEGEPAGGVQEGVEPDDPAV
ncbi:STAS domain-containing protein [Streptomyces sp. NPDC060020]|uniref:STAS domain-containing protein n=1 Tax=Streptomyces sp. NPDC060020 TaxID=3347038 RepID=UPI00367FF4FF